MPCSLPGLFSRGKDSRPSKNQGTYRACGGRKLEPSTLSQAFLKFRRKAGLPEEFSLHSTRHTVESWLAQRGVPVTVIQRLMGHSTVTTTERYMSMRADVTQQWVRQAFEE